MELWVELRVELWVKGGVGGEDYATCTITQAL